MPVISDRDRRLHPVNTAVVLYEVTSLGTALDSLRVNGVEGGVTILTLTYFSLHSRREKLNVGLLNSGEAVVCFNVPCRTEQR